MSKGLLNACKKKNNLYRNFVLKRTAKSETKYKSYKNKLTSILRLSEKHYYCTLLEKNRENIKTTWNIVNSIIKKKEIQMMIYPAYLYMEGK